MRKTKAGTDVTTMVGSIAIPGMLIAAFGAYRYDAALGSLSHQDGLQHLEIVEVLPYFFWFAVSFSLLLGRQQVARTLCNWRCLCWAGAGGILARLLFRVALGDITTIDHYSQWLSQPPVDAAASVLTWLCTLMGAVGGAALAWQLPVRPLSQRSCNWLVWGLVAVLAMPLVVAAFMWPAVLVLGLLCLTPDRFDHGLGQQVVAAIAAGALKPDTNGEVVLPPRYKSISVTGSAFITRGRKGLVLIFIPTSYGHTGNEGYLHCSRSLTPEDTWGEDPASGHARIAAYYDLNHHDFSRYVRGRKLPPQFSRLSPRQLNAYFRRRMPPHRLSIQKLNENWYRTYEPE
jgi:hypothetical protein